MSEEKQVGNMGAKIWERLRLIAKDKRVDTQSMATNYAIERFMSRLMETDENNIITVKGGQSLGLLFGNNMRPTKDLDINIDLQEGENYAELVEKTIYQACALETTDGLNITVDDMLFDHREHQGGKGGVRVKIQAKIHTCKVDFVIDIGIGNEMSFAPSQITVPGVLANQKISPPALQAKVYPHENTLAEKIISKVEDGIASIRHKDFFDIWLSIETLRRIGDLKLLVDLEENMQLDQLQKVILVKDSLKNGTLLELPLTDINEECLDRLGEAMYKTSESRNTEIPDNLMSWLRDEFANDSVHVKQWINWCRNQKDRLLYQPPGTNKDDNPEEAFHTLFNSIEDVISDVSKRAIQHKQNITPTFKM